MLFKRRPNLLIGSVFSKNERSKGWYDLQIKFIKNTTQNFDHVVVLDDAEEHIFCNSKIIGKIDRLPTASERHCDGLNQIIQYAKDKNYEYLLLLDSDAFPIRKNWLDFITSNMQNHSIAAVLRTENLDTFAHPSIYFIKENKIKEVKFEYQEGLNLLNLNFKDSMSNQKEFYPLIRTNCLNLHPVLYGIYKDTFYHHGAGSRVATIRSVDFYKYYGEIKFNEDLNYENLLKDPKKFINKLRMINDNI